MNVTALARLTARFGLPRTPAFFIPSGAAHEAHLSTQQDRAQASARVPRPHGHQRRPKGPGAPARAGPQEAIRLSRPPKPVGALRLATMKKRADFLKAAKGVRRSLNSLMLEVALTPDY